MLAIFFLCSILAIIQFNTYINYLFKKHEDLQKSFNNKCRTSLVNPDAFQPFKFSRIEYLFIILYQFVYFLFSLLMLFYCIILVDYSINNYKKIKGNILGNPFTPEGKSFSEVIKSYIPSFSSFFDLENPNRSGYTFIMKIFSLVAINVVVNAFLIFSVIMLNEAKVEEESKKKIKTEFYILSIMSLIVSLASFFYFS